MKLKIGLVINILIICLGANACQSTKETDFLTEYKKTADEIVKIVEANPTSDGVVKASEYLNHQKKSLKFKFETNKILNTKNPKIDNQVAKISELFKKYPAIQPELKKLGLDFIEF